MIKTFVNAWKIPELRKKILFTAFIILIFRIGSVIPVPFVNLADGLDSSVYAGTFIQYLNIHIWYNLCDVNHTVHQQFNYYAAFNSCNSRT